MDVQITGRGGVDWIKLTQKIFTGLLFHKYINEITFTLAVEAKVSSENLVITHKAINYAITHNIRSHSRIRVLLFIDHLYKYRALKKNPAPVSQLDTGNSF